MVHPLLKLSTVLSQNQAIAHFDVCLDMFENFKFTKNYTVWVFIIAFVYYQNLVADKMSFSRWKCEQLQVHLDNDSSYDNKNLAV